MSEYMNCRKDGREGVCDGRHELDSDVEGDADDVFTRVADCVADDGSFMGG